MADRSDQPAGTIKEFQNSAGPEIRSGRDKTQISIGQPLYADPILLLPIVPRRRIEDRVGSALDPIQISI